MEPGNKHKYQKVNRDCFHHTAELQRYINMLMVFYNMSICSSVKFLPYNVNVHVNLRMLNFELKYTIFSFFNYI